MCPDNHNLVLRHFCNFHVYLLWFPLVTYILFCIYIFFNPEKKKKYVYMYIRARDVRRDAHKFACRIVQLIRATSLYKASILPLIKEKMNSLKARLISLKKRVCRLCCKKRKSVRRKTAALYSRRVTSSLRKLSTIRRLRMTISKALIFFYCYYCFTLLVRQI